MDRVVFQSEFAMVEVRSDHSGNGARLHIKDLGSSNEIFLDPLELEALTRVGHDFFVPLVAPETREQPTPADDIGL